MNINYSDKLFNLADFRKYSDTFIETGTCAGDGVQRAIDAGFTKIRSVELSNRFFVQSCDRLEKTFALVNSGPYHETFGSVDVTIELYVGDSIRHLPEMLNKSPNMSVIFLDAHPAGPGTAGHDDLMEKGSKSEFQQDKIITRELELIFTPDAWRYPVVMIDDVNGLNTESQKYIDFILSEEPGYNFTFYNQKLGNIKYHNKILVCTP